ncbi:hypothetical protein CYMTET_56486 [Cymbomonas tetramitiformis]|uniref:Uncharacterized protein n=1 Tax=Cymbomonas tetramitiformis TaxID=36881 RepID=A0AAE0BC06_9CHLO|nr:hypothetical protein CYMTET_56486 [Cymbomonas tetramitiformis]
MQNPSLRTEIDFDDVSRGGAASRKSEDDQKRAKPAVNFLGHAENYAELSRTAIASRSFHRSMSRMSQILFPFSYSQGRWHIVHNVSFRKRFARRLETSEGIFFFMDSISAFLSLLSIFVYVLETYGVDDSVRQGLFFSELACAIFFFIEFLIMHASERVIWYLLSFPALVDMLTIFPVILQLADSQSNTNLSFLRMVRLMRMMRLLRILRVHRLMQHSDSEIHRHVFVLVFTVVSVIFCTAGLLQMVDTQDLEFHDALYLTVITVSTVGYGDLAPESIFSKVIIVCMLGFTFVVVPMEMNALVSQLSLSDVYTRAFFRSRGHKTHIVICGNFDYRSLLSVLNEFFHEDHGFGETDICLLAPKPPTPEIKQLLIKNRFPRRVEYLSGSAREEKDMFRSQMRRARGIFFMCDKYNVQSSEEDAFVIMLVLAVQNHLYNQRDKGAGVVNFSPRQFVQVLSPDSRKLLEASILARDNAEEIYAQMQIICEELLPWQKEYWHGLAHELYRCPLSSAFIGCTFKQMAHRVYQETQAVLIGLEVRSRADDKARLMLSPMNYVITDVSNTIGFIIAQDLRTALYVASFTADVEEAGPADMRYDTVMSPMQQQKNQGLHRGSIHIKSQLEASHRSHVNIFLAKKIQSRPKLGANRTFSRARLSSSGESNIPASSTNSPAFKSKDKRRKGVMVKSKVRQKARRMLKAISVPKKSRKEAREVEEECEDGDRPPMNRMSVKWKLTKDKMVEQSLLNRMDTRLDKLMLRLDGMKSKYHLRTPLTLEEATIVNVPFSGHIVVCGSVTNLFHLIAPLRQIHLERIRPVAVMSALPPLGSDWMEVAMLPSVYFIQGSALNDDDLERVNIRGAHTAIVLRSSMSSAAGPSDQHQSKEYFLDSNMIFTFQHIRAKSLQVQILTELISTDSMAFIMPLMNLGPNLSSRDVVLTHLPPPLPGPPRFDTHSPPLADLGELPTLCWPQGHLKPSPRRSKHITPRSLSEGEGRAEERGAAGVCGRSESTGVEGAGWQLATPYSMGSVYLACVLDTLLIQAYFNSDILSIIRKLLTPQCDVEIFSLPAVQRAEAGSASEDGGSETEGSPVGCPVESFSKCLDDDAITTAVLPIDAAFIGKAYFQLFNHVLHHESQLCLGLYRAGDSDLGTAHPYVYTNPKPETVIKKGDRLYVMSQADVSKHPPTDGMILPDNEALHLKKGAERLDASAIHQGMRQAQRRAISLKNPDKMRQGNDGELKEKASPSPRSPSSAAWHPVLPDKSLWTSEPNPADSSANAAAAKDCEIPDYLRSHPVDDKAPHQSAAGGGEKRRVSNEYRQRSISSHSEEGLDGEDTGILDSVQVNQGTTSFHDRPLSRQLSTSFELVQSRINSMRAKRPRHAAPMPLEMLDELTKYRNSIDESSRSGISNEDTVEMMIQILQPLTLAMTAMNDEVMQELSCIRNDLDAVRRKQM